MTSLDTGGAKTANGLRNGLIGVAIFSGSLPATRLAVQQFDPIFLTVARAVIAGLLALVLLLVLRQRRPAKADLLSLVIVALGVVIGFPLLTALALQYVTSAHSIVFIGLLPLSTAIFGVLRGAERPKPAGQCARRRLCPGAGAHGVSDRRSADAGRHRGLRPRLC